MELLKKGGYRQDADRGDDQDGYDHFYGGEADAAQGAETTMDIPPWRHYRLSVTDRSCSEPRFHQVIWDRCLSRSALTDAS